MIRFACSLVLLCAALGAAAQGYPNRAVTIVVPYPPGGLIDIVARILQPRLQTELGQSVVIENRSGAGGNVGAEAVAKSAPDGYTLLLANPSLGISPHLYDKLNYKPIESFAYVGMYGTVPNVLVVNPSVPAKSVSDLVTLVKEKPDKLTFSSGGFGTPAHLIGEMFKLQTGGRARQQPITRRRELRAQPRGLRLLAEDAAILAEIKRARVVLCTAPSVM